MILVVAAAAAACEQDRPLSQKPTITIIDASRQRLVTQREARLGSGQKDPRALTSFVPGLQASRFSTGPAVSFPRAGRFSGTPALVHNSTSGEYRLLAYGHVDGSDTNGFDIGDSSHVGSYAAIYGGLDGSPSDSPTLCAYGETAGLAYGDIAVSIDGSHFYLVDDSQHLNIFTNDFGQCDGSQITPTLLNLGNNWPSTDGRTITRAIAPFVDYATGLIYVTDANSYFWRISLEGAGSATRLLDDMPVSTGEVSPPVVFHDIAWMGGASGLLYRVSNAAGVNASPTKTYLDVCSGIDAQGACSGVVSTPFIDGTQSSTRITVAVDKRVVVLDESCTSECPVGPARPGNMVSGSNTITRYSAVAIDLSTEVDNLYWAHNDANDLVMERLSYRASMENGVLVAASGPTMIGKANAGIAGAPPLLLNGRVFLGDNTGALLAVERDFSTSLRDFNSNASQLSGTINASLISDGNWLYSTTSTNLGRVDSGRKRVFVSSSQYSVTDFGSLAGADNKCTDLAADAKLSGHYKAWLSDNGTNALSHIGNNDRNAYVLAGNADTYGQVLVAYGFDLGSNSLRHAINRDENNNPRMSTVVWTGSYANGSVLVDNTCCSWLATNDNDCDHFTAMAGVSDASDITWSEFVSPSCSNSASLYCFEY